MQEIVSWIEHILPWFQSPLGMFLFIPIYAVWVTFLLPGVWISMVAGALYGPLLGSLVAFIGACVGAITSFLLGRNLARDWLLSKISTNKKFSTVSNEIKEQGVKLILLTRLSPAFPFSLLNLAYGLSEVTFKDYAIGLLGIMPGTILFCNLGSFAGDIENFRAVIAGKEGMGFLVVRIIGLLSTCLVILLGTRSFKRILKNQID